MYVIGLCCIGNNIPWGLSAHFYQPFLPPGPISQIDGLPYLFIVGCSSRVVGTSTRLSPPLFPTGRKEGGGMLLPRLPGLSYTALALGSLLLAERLSFAGKHLPTLGDEDVESCYLCKTREMMNGGRTGGLERRVGDEESVHASSTSENPLSSRLSAS